MSDLYDDDDAVPESQKRAAMQHAQDEVSKAASRLRGAKNSEERKRAEYDLAGAQAALRNCGNWRTK
jgi:hypothetical protein